MSHEVQETADDAITSKLSAVQQGYIDDPYISNFVSRARRRAPLINRGYFARIAAVEELMLKFVGIVEAMGAACCQVVSLGAGLDTSFWKLTDRTTFPVRYVELDLPDVARPKVMAVRDKEALHSRLTDAVFTLSDATGAAEIHSKWYHYVNADLRDTDAVAAALAASGVDTSVPTFFLSECVMVYMEPAESGAIIGWAASHFPAAVFVTYEQVHPHDAFGQVMMKNLASRGCPLRGLPAFPDTAAQEVRFKSLGWGAASCVDMNTVFNAFLPKERVDRAKRAELFDEFEEWHLVSSHYCFCVAVNGGSSVGGEAGDAADDDGPDGGVAGAGAGSGAGPGAGAAPVPAATSATTPAPPPPSLSATTPAPPPPSLSATTPAPPPPSLSAMLFH